MKYPIGIQSFDRIIEDGYVYIDKTDMVYNLVREGSIYFLSRPRRFGKSLLVSTLKNYFMGRKELFRGLKIDRLEKEWNAYPVFHIDFNGGEYTCSGLLKDAIISYLSDWEREYGINDGFQDANPGFRFRKILAKAHEQSGRRAVADRWMKRYGFIPTCLMWTRHWRRNTAISSKASIPYSRRQTSTFSSSSSQA